MLSVRLLAFSHYAFLDHSFETIGDIARPNSAKPSYVTSELIFAHYSFLS